MFDCYRETTPAPVTSNASVNTSANIRLDVLSNGAPVSNVVIGDMISLRLTLTTDSRKYSLTYLLIYLLTHLLIYSLTYLFTHLLTYLLTFLLTYLLTDFRTYLFTTCLLTYVLTYLLIYLSHDLIQAMYSKPK